MAEHIKRYCYCCGLLLSKTMTANELVQCGAGTNMGDGSILFHCRKHTKEEIVKALARDIRFHRASQEKQR